MKKINSKKLKKMSLTELEELLLQENLEERQLVMEEFKQKLKTHYLTIANSGKKKSKNKWFK